MIYEVGGTSDGESTSILKIDLTQLAGVQITDLMIENEKGEGEWQCVVFLNAGGMMSINATKKVAMDLMQEWENRVQPN